MTNPWYFSYDKNLMSWIYLYLACYLTHVGTWLNQIPWDCNLVISWEISTSPSLYTMVVEDKEPWNHSNISFDNFYVELHDCHLWIHKCSSLQELTHVGKLKVQLTPKDCSKWSTSTLSIYIFKTYMKSSSTKPKVSSSLLGGISHLGRALP